MSQTKTKQPLTQSELKSYAMGLLARREFGRHELWQKLSAKGQNQDAEAVLDWLIEQNLQSDQRFARILLRSKAERGYGPQRIRQEMKQKRLDSDAIVQAFEAYEGDWFELALATYEKKFRQPLGSDPKDRAKRQRFMHYRGYNGDQISYAMEQGHQEYTNS